MYKSLLTNHPLVNILFTVVLVMGALSYFELPREQDPEINFNWVNINTILPGLIKTDFAKALWSDDARRTAREAATPMRRIGEPRDIGGVAAFLATEAAAYVTGQMIIVDGGVTISGS